MAVVDLGLQRAEFWKLTPRHFHFLTDRYQAKERRLDERTALLAAIQANSVPRKGGKAFTIRDFMPKVGKETIHRQSSADMMANIRMRGFGRFEYEDGRQEDLKKPVIGEIYLEDAEGNKTPIG